MSGVLRRLVSWALLRMYGRVPASTFLLRLVTRWEGGHMSSVTLRAVLRAHHGVEVGQHSYGSLLVPGMADRGTIIGRYVSVGPHVRRIGAAHPLESPSLHPYWYNPRLGFVTPDHDVERTPCEIGHDAWIGANVVILPGCRRIGIGAVVGAGSIVTKDVADFAVVVGNPARQIALRFDPEFRERLLDEAPWALEPTEARVHLQRLERGVP